MSAATIAIAPFENLSGDPAQDYFARWDSSRTWRLSSPGFARWKSFTLARSAPLRTRGADSDRADSGRPHRPRQRSPRRGAPCESMCSSSRRPTAGRSGRTATRRPPWTFTRCRTLSRRASRGPSPCRSTRPGWAWPGEHPSRVSRCTIAGCAGSNASARARVEADAEARRFFERALEIDPTYARAYAGLSLSHFNEWSCQAWVKWDEKERLAHDYARRALDAR